MADSKYGLSQIAPNNGAVIRYYGKGPNAYSPTPCLYAGLCILGLSVNAANILFASNSATKQVIAIGANNGNVDIIDSSILSPVGLSVECTYSNIYVSFSAQLQYVDVL